MSLDCPNLESDMSDSRLGQSNDMALEDYPTSIPHLWVLLEILHAGTEGREALNIPQARPLLSTVQGLDIAAIAAIAARACGSNLGSM